MNDALQEAAARLRGASRVLVLSGAGVSAESGVPTFRGPEGLWRRFRPEELATPEAVARQPFTDFLEQFPSDEHLVKQCLALEQEFFLPDHNLAYTDKMSMAEGVEVRVPLLDRELVWVCRAQPASNLMRRAVPKALLKDAMRGILPDQIIDRQKVGFGALVRRWIVNELRDVVHDCLSPSRIRNRGLFEPAHVTELIDRNEHGHVDGAYLILALICVELWMRQFVDGGYAWGKSP